MYLGLKIGASQQNMLVHVFLLLKICLSRSLHFGWELGEMRPTTGLGTVYKVTDWAAWRSTNIALKFQQTWGSPPVPKRSTDVFILAVLRVQHFRGTYIPFLPLWRWIFPTRNTEVPYHGSHLQSSSLAGWGWMFIRNIAETTLEIWKTQSSQTCYPCSWICWKMPFSVQFPCICGCENLVWLIYGSAFSVLPLNLSEADDAGGFQNQKTLWESFFLHLDFAN